MQSYHELPGQLQVKTDEMLAHGLNNSCAIAFLPRESLKHGLESILGHALHYGYKVSGDVEIKPFSIKSA